jgi:hypothetical protein
MIRGERVMTSDERSKTPPNTSQLTSAYSCFVIKPEGKRLDEEDDEALVVAITMASDDEDEGTRTRRDYGLMAKSERVPGPFPGQYVFPVIYCPAYRPLSPAYDSSFPNNRNEV